MGLSWRRGPLSPGAIGKFLVPDPLPKRLLYAEPLRRRMRVRYSGEWSYRYRGRGPALEPGSFEPDIVSVQLDGAQLRLEPGQTVIPHGPDRELDVAEALVPGKQA